MPQFKVNDTINMNGITYKVKNIPEINEVNPDPVYILIDSKNNISYNLISYVDKHATIDVSNSFQNMKISGGKRRTHRKKLRKKRRKTNRRKTNRRR